MGQKNTPPASETQTLTERLVRIENKLDKLMDDINLIGSAMAEVLKDTGSIAPLITGRGPNT